MHTHVQTHMCTDTHTHTNTRTHECAHTHPPHTHDQNRQKWHTIQTKALDICANIRNQYLYVLTVTYKTQSPLTLYWYIQTYTQYPVKRNKTAQTAEQC